MKALRFTQFGEPTVLSIMELDVPAPREGEVLVKIEAASINPSDAKNVAGAFKATTLPRTPGRDFAGTIVQGAKRESEEVWGSVADLGITRDGSHAEYVVVPAALAVRKPKTLSMAQSAALGVAYLTAWAAIADAAQVQEGETVLIVGAGGSVGRAATEIANLKGARVIGAVLGSSPLPGVTALVDTGGQEWYKQVHDLTQGHGVDVVLDAVGGKMFEPALESLRPGGRQVAITSSGGSRVSFDLIRFYHNRSRLIGVDSTAFTEEQISRIAAEITRGIEAGALTPAEVETIPLDGAVAAYQKVLSGHAKQKQVIAF